MKIEWKASPMALKLLYLPNESDETDPRQLQIGPRKAFQGLINEGILSEVSCFSFLSRFRTSGNANIVRADLLSEVKRLKPDVIFWQHVSTFPVDSGFVEELRNASDRCLLVYHEADAFGKRVKGITPQMKVLLAHSDLIFVCGMNPMSGLMRQNGAKDVRYLPHSYDNIRSDQSWDPHKVREFDVSMIGNLVQKWFFLPDFPGAKDRQHLAQRLSDLFGQSCALYGNGWDGLKSNLGKLPYEMQERAIQNSWLSANWNHFPEIGYYTSDRIPIALAAGVVHVTNYQPGYEYLFSGCPGLYTCGTVDEEIACIEWLLSRPKHELISEGMQAREWVRSRFEADVVYRRAIEICSEKLLSGKRR